jgi:hypothetical protein
VPRQEPVSQYDSLLKKSDEFARTIQSSALSKSEAWTAYFSFYLPKMCYGLNTSFLTEAQLTEVQKKATTALFRKCRKCGFNRTTATTVKFAPPPPWRDRIPGTIYGAITAAHVHGPQTPPNPGPS